MSDNLAYMVKKFLIPAGIYISAVYGGLDFLTKPFVYWSDNPKITTTQFLNKLLVIESPIFGGYGVGYLWLLFLVILLLATIIYLVIGLRFASDYLERSRVPLSVLSSDIILEFNDDWSRCELTRKQLLRANKPNVNAYLYHLYAHAGSIDIKSIKSELDGRDFTKKVHGQSEGKVIDCIEEFKEALPFSFLVTYLPDFLVLFAFEKLGLFRGAILKRSIVSVDIGEYGSSMPKFEARTKNKVAKISLKLKFPEGNEPANGVRAYLIEEGAITSASVTVIFQAKQQIYTVRRSALNAAQTLRVLWDPRK